MKLFSVASGVLAAAIVTNVYAADLVIYDPAPVTSPAPASYDWTGFYAGVLGGYGYAQDDVRTTLMNGATPWLPSASNSFDAAGWLGGIRVGGDVQFDHFVLGIEGQYLASGIAGEFNFDPLRPEAMAGGSLTNLLSIRGRAGVAFDRTLVYGSVGFATAENQGWANNVWNAAPAVDAATGSGRVNGYVLGVGIEQAITDNISLTAAYDHYGFARGDFDMTSDAYPAGTVLRAEPLITLGTVTAGLNFRF